MKSTLTTLKREHDVRWAAAMSLTGIVGDLPEWSYTCGNYFWIIDGAEIGYVGVAQNLYRRNKSHGRHLANGSDGLIYAEMRQLLKAGHKLSLWLLIEPKVQTTKDRWIDGRHSIEADCIARFQPRWNTLGNRSSWVAKIRDHWKDEFPKGMTDNKLIQIMQDYGATTVGEGGAALWEFLNPGKEPETA